MHRKLRRRTGFTLTETLITIVILALVTAAGTAGVTAVLAVRNRMIQVSNAQVLASAAAEAVADELRFGRRIKVVEANTAVTLDSSLFDRECTLRLSKDDPAEKTPAGRTVPAGRLVMQRTEAGSTDPVLREVLGKDLYEDLQFSALTFTVNGAGSAAAIQVDMTVADNDGRTLWQAEFTVVPLNGASSG